MIKDKQLILETECIKEEYYQQILKLMSNIPPYTKLRPKTMFVLGWLYYYFNEGEEVFEKKTRDKLIDHIIEVNSYRDIPDGDSYEKAYGTLGNLVSELKKHNFIIMEAGRKVLNPKYIIRLNIMEGITFKFNIKEKKNGRN